MLLAMGVLTRISVLYAHISFAKSYLAHLIDAIAYSLYFRDIENLPKNPSNNVGNKRNKSRAPPTAESTPDELPLDEELLLDEVELLEDELLPDDELLLDDELLEEELLEEEPLEEEPLLDEVLLFINASMVEA
jgi:hypothetical protein